MRPWIALLVLLIVPFPAFGSDMDLPRLLQLAGDHNPAIRADVANWESALAMARQSRAYPNPELDFSRRDASLRGDDSGMTEVALVQPVVLGRRLGARQRAAAAMARRAEQRLEETRRQVKREVYNLWVRLRYYAVLGRLQDELMAVSGELLDAMEAKGLDPGDPALVRAQTAHLQDELEVVRILSESIFASEELSALLGGMPVPLSDLRGDLETGINVDRLAFRTSDVVEESPGVLGNAMLAESFDHSAEEYRASLLPDVRFRMGLGYDHRDDEAVGTVGVSIPLPVLDRSRGRRASAEAEARRYRSLAEDASNRVRSRLAVATQRVNELDTLAGEYARAILPALDLALAEGRRRFRDGALTFEEFLDVQRRHHEAHARYLEYVRDLNLAYGELAELTGEWD